MLNGKREGWIEAAVIVGGSTVDPETPLVRACEPNKLRAVRRRLLGLPCAKTEGAQLADGDIVLDFHRDEPGEGGGVEFYVLDPVAFSAPDALAVLPDVIGIPREAILRHIEQHMPSALRA